MKSYPAPLTEETILAGLRNSVDAGASQEELIREMRDAGLGIIPSIKSLSEFLQIPIAEAKRIVHCSQTWSDCRTAHDALHQAAFQAVQELGVSSRDKEKSLQAT